MRSHGLTPRHYQLMLALRSFPGREWATMRGLADRIQLRHHSMVEPVNPTQKHGLVLPAPDPTDTRVVRAQLADTGQSILARLSALHLV